MFVYRYIDINTSTIKYIGIVTRNSYSDLKQRLIVHSYYDKWCRNGNYKVEYIICENKSEVHSLESHFIAKYHTYNYYNKSKSDWGLNKYIYDNFKWEHFCDIYNGKCEIVASQKIINRNGKTKVKSVLEWLKKQDIGTEFDSRDMLKELGLTSEDLKMVKKSSKFLKDLFKNMKVDGTRSKYKTIQL